MEVCPRRGPPAARRDRELGDAETTTGSPRSRARRDRGRQRVDGDVASPSRSSPSSRRRRGHYEARSQPVSYTSWWLRYEDRRWFDEVASSMMQRPPPVAEVVRAETGRAPARRGDRGASPASIALDAPTRWWHRSAITTRIAHVVVAPMRRRRRWAEVRSAFRSASERRRYLKLMPLVVTAQASVGPASNGARVTSRPSSAVTITW